MANKKTNEDYEIMRQYSLSTAVDRKIINNASNQLDIAGANVATAEKFVDESLLLKKELLHLFATARKEGMTADLQKRIINTRNQLSALTAPKMLEQEAVETQEIFQSYNEMTQSNIEFAKKMDIDLSNPYFAALSNIDSYILYQELSEKFDLLNLDKYDYAFAAAVGLTCGGIDALLIGTAGNESKDIGKLAQKNDAFFDKLVQQYAKKCGWEGPKIHAYGTQSNATKSACGYLERTYPVNYDHRYKSDFDEAKLFQNFGLDDLSAKNHHLKSFGHSPLGLIIAVFDLLQNKATYYDSTNGKIIRAVGKYSQKAIEEGKEVKTVSEAVVRWFSHLMSDIAGASGSSGRGSGIPTGMESILQTFNFGKIPLANDSSGTIGEAITKMFENGFDFRFSVATSIPVIINEVLIRLYWFFKLHFYKGMPIKDSIPVGKKREIQRLLLISTASFSTVDVTHAIVKGVSAEDPIMMLNSLNYIGLADLGYRVFANFKLEHEHNEEVKKILNEDIKRKHEELMKTGFC